MSAKIEYTDEPLGKVQVVADFLRRPPARVRRILNNRHPHLPSCGRMSKWPSAKAKRALAALFDAQSCELW